MKKLLFVLVIASFVACNNSENKETTSDTSTVVTQDTSQVVTDTTVTVDTLNNK